MHVSFTSCYFFCSADKKENLEHLENFYLYCIWKKKTFVMFLCLHHQDNALKQVFCSVAYSLFPLNEPDYLRQDFAILYIGILHRNSLNKFILSLGTDVFALLISMRISLGLNEDRNLKLPCLNCLHLAPMTIDWKPGQLKIV